MAVSVRQDEPSRSCSSDEREIRVAAAEGVASSQSRSLSAILRPSFALRWSAKAMSAMVCASRRRRRRSATAVPVQRGSAFIARRHLTLARCALPRRRRGRVISSSQLSMGIGRRGSTSCRLGGAAAGGSGGEILGFGRKGHRNSSHRAGARVSVTRCSDQCVRCREDGAAGRALRGPPVAAIAAQPILWCDEPSGEAVAFNLR